jgi:hypothetical protein
MMRKYQDGGGVQPFSSSYALQPAQQQPVMIDLQDTRKINPVTGKPFTDKQRKSVKVDQENVKSIISQAKAAGIDPYTALAISYQESGFQNGDKLFNLNPEVFGKPFGNAEEGMKGLQYNFNIGKSLAKRGVIPDSEEFLLQSNNGYGKIKRGHADLEGAGSIYGMPIPEEGIDFKKNPYYGQTVISLRDDILKKNQSINDLIQNTPAMKKSVKKYADGGLVDGPGPGTGDPLSPAEQKIADQYTKMGYTVTKTNGKLTYIKNGAAPAMTQPTSKIVQPVEQAPKAAVARPQAAQVTAPTASANSSISPTALKQKYSSNPYLVGQNNRYFWATQTDREFPLTDGNVKDAIKSAATYNKVDPALLYASAMEEGMSGAIDDKNWENASEDYVNWSTKNPDKSKQFPVDSFYNYGLDQFSGMAPALIKKGYLPKDFQNNFTTFDTVNEKQEKLKASAFNTDANALMAKSAMMRLANDQLGEYSKSKGYNLTPEQKEFFMLANYNGGQGNMQKMLDSYNQKGYLKNNDFLNTNFTPESYGGIYKNVQARIQAAKMLRGENAFKYGGTIPNTPKGVPKYAEGGSVETGPGEGKEPTYSDQENYYRNSAKLAHYKTLLNDKLKAKNPQAFGEFFKGLQPLRQAGNTKGAGDYIQNSQYNDYLSADEVKKSLGNDYQDYLNTIQQVNTFDIAQGKQPLYGTQETGTDLNNLNYGRRFASLASTPSFSATNKTSGTTYNRQYSYDPKSKQVSFTENGDTKLRPDYLVPPQMKNGGKIPKYADGTEDPIKGVKSFQPAGSTPNNWQTNNNPVPINPDATPDQQIFNLDQDQSQGNVKGIKPLSQFYDIGTDKWGNQTFTGSGRYIDDNGNTTTTAEQQVNADVISNQNRVRAMGLDTKADNVEFAATTGMAAINAFFAKQQAGKVDRTNRRRAIMQQVEAPTINPYAEGTGSQAIMEHGGSIHIKPENRGKFNATKKRTGKTTEELTHSSNPVTRKRAIFAQNAAKWHHGEDGLSLDNQDPTNQMKVIDGGKVEQLSSSDHSNPMFEFQGKTHDEGGIGLQYGNNLAEVENDEVGWVDNNGDLNVFGKLKLPGTNQTFKKAAMDIAEQEKKVDGKKSKYLNTLTNGSDTDPYQESAKSTAKVMFKSLDKQAKQIAEKKEALASYQNLILAMKDQMMAEQKMAYGGKMPTFPKYADGGSIGGPGDEDEVAKVRKAIAEFESGADYSAIGVPVSKGQYKGQRALGKYQIMEDNVKSWGKAATGKDVTVADFIKDPKLQDQIAEYQMKQIAKSHPNPADIASIWFTGQPTSNSKAQSRVDDNGTSGNHYVDAVMKIYSGYGGTNTQRGSTGNIDNTSGAKALSNGKLVSTNDIMNYTPINNPVNGQEDQVVTTPYGNAKREATPFNSKVNIGNGDRQRGAISPLAIEQIAPELATIASNRREPVYQLGYQPDLQQTFDLSYQLGRNENQSTFNQLSQQAEQGGNYEALAQLAAQKYQADQAYNMQEVQGNAQQKMQVYGQNMATLNDAKVKNLALIADQQQKQAMAKDNTRKEDLAALRSVSGKVLQNQLENRTYNAYANLFTHYGFDKNGNVTFNPDKVTQKFTAGEAQQFGMMAAQQGASAIMNGDYSRQFTKVKNTDGSTTTTEQLGTNKKIQEEYSTLKKQGFDDQIIGNMLRAKYPETISND